MSPAVLSARNSGTSFAMPSVSGPTAGGRKRSTGAGPSGSSPSMGRNTPIPVENGLELGLLSVPGLTYTRKRGRSGGTIFTRRFSRKPQGSLAKGGDPEESRLPHPPAFLRHLSPGGGLRGSEDPGTTGPQGREPYHDLHPYPEPGGKRGTKPPGFPSGIPAFPGPILFLGPGIPARLGRAPGRRVETRTGGNWGTGIGCRFLQPILLVATSPR